MASEQTIASKSETVLESIKKAQRSREVVDVDQETAKVVIFESSGARYAFPGSHVGEIIQQSPISWVPGLPAYLPGLINVRGDIESVVDLRHFLGGNGATEAGPMVIMVAHGDFRTGILVEAVFDVVDILVSSIKPPLATLHGTVRDLVAGEFEYDGRPTTLLDTERLAAKIRL